MDQLLWQESIDFPPPCTLTPELQSTFDSSETYDFLRDICEYGHICSTITTRYSGANKALGWTCSKEYYVPTSEDDFRKGIIVLLHDWRTKASQYSFNTGSLKPPGFLQTSEIRYHEVIIALFATSPSTTWATFPTKLSPKLSEFGGETTILDSARDFLSHLSSYDTRDLFQSR